MRGSASIGVLVSVLALAAAALPAGGCLADEPVRWRAEPTLVLERSSTNCGAQYREPVGIEFDGKVVKTTAWSRRTYDLILFEPLAADGSGQVYGLSLPHNVSVVLKFDPGHGPRNITYWARYNARCVWTFVPI
jgi:hypothetical protein